jgi:hypothetical protein
MIAAAGQSSRRILRRPLAALLAALLIAVQLGALHAHHDAREESECGLCMLAHTPLVQAPPLPPLFPQQVNLGSEPGTSPDAPDASPHYLVPPRSPPSF